MRTVTNWRIRREPEAWQRHAGRYNPGSQLIVRTKTARLIVPLGAGSSDDVEVFSEGGLLYIVTCNASLDYVGLETVPADPAEPEGAAFTDNVFFQGDEQIREVLGPRGLDLTPRTMARRLAQYLAC